MKSAVGIRVKVVLVGVSMLAALSGCTFGSWDREIVHGSGNVITEQRQVSGFTEVELTIGGELVIEQDGTEAMSVEAEDNIAPLITSEVRGNRLTIGNRDGSIISSTRPVRIHISVKDLSYIGNTGAGNVSMNGVKGASLQTYNTDSGSITVVGIATAVYTSRSSGSGGTTASGVAGRLDVEGTGSGSFEGAALESDDAKVVLTGGGDATVRVSRTLDASVTGRGSVRYMGNPVLTANDRGPGEIVNVAVR
jgi:Putative auto-transporter adhesin, head GIN domain